ncbi:MAG: HNH endonuclease [Isosphaeraceae bacterium]
MRISKQISGNRSMRDEGGKQGRGEYEWCDLTPADPTHADLMNRRILIELPDGIRIDTDCILGDRQGKNRIRTAPTATVKRNIYPHYHIAVTLMMPWPSRTETNWGTGLPIMRTEEYGIVDLFLARPPQLHGTEEVLTDFAQLQIANNSSQEFIEIPARFADVQRLWQNRSQFYSVISGLLEAHERIVRGGHLISIEGQNIVSKLQAEAANQSEEYGLPGRSRVEDPLPSLLQMLGLQVDEPETPFLEIPIERPEIRRRELARRRQKLATARDPASVRFRRVVREAYDFRCVACGLRLPPLGSGSKPGVDSCHILPDSEFDLNHITNGICHCKLHHWAFDEGLFEIRYDEAAAAQPGRSGYSIVVPEEAVERASGGLIAGMDLAFLRILEGSIAPDRLPSNRRDWPDPRCLNRLREFLYP